MTPEVGEAVHDDQFIAEIHGELARATTLLSQLPSGITIFGSARITPDAESYRCARRLGQWLARAQLPVLTGGGPGIMEAVNQGAYEQGGVSVGLGIQLPYEETPNRYLSHRLHFKHFASRKLMLTRYSSGFVAFPGGFGTTDELMELLVASRAGDSENRPVVLVDGSFWRGLLDWFKNELADRKLIDIGGADFIQVVNDECSVLDALLGQDTTAALMGQYPLPS